MAEEEGRKSVIAVYFFILLYYFFWWQHWLEFFIHTFSLFFKLQPQSPLIAVSQVP